MRVYRDRGSEAYFRKTRKRLGRIRCAYLDTALSPYSLQIWDENGNSISLSGCKCGHRGEGSDASITILKECRFRFEPEEIYSNPVIFLGPEKEADVQRKAELERIAETCADFLIEIEEQRANE